LLHLVPFPAIFPDNISAGTFDPGLVVDSLVFGDAFFEASKDFTLTDF
jgi:hypothetical protein